MSASEWGSLVLSIYILYRCIRCYDKARNFYGTISRYEYIGTPTHAPMCAKQYALHRYKMERHETGSGALFRAHRPELEIVRTRGLPLAGDDGGMTDRRAISARGMLLLLRRSYLTELNPL